MSDNEDIDALHHEDDEITDVKIKLEDTHIYDLPESDTLNKRPRIEATQKVDTIQEEAEDTEREEEEGGEGDEEEEGDDEEEREEEEEESAKEEEREEKEDVKEEEVTDTKEENKEEMFAANTVLIDTKAPSAYDMYAPHHPSYLKNEDFTFDVIFGKEFKSFMVHDHTLKFIKEAWFLTSLLKLPFFDKIVSAPRICYPIVPGEKQATRVNYMSMSMVMEIYSAAKYFITMKYKNILDENTKPPLSEEEKQNIKNAKKRILNPNNTVGTNDSKSKVTLIDVEGFDMRDDNGKHPFLSDKYIAQIEASYEDSIGKLWNEIKAHSNNVSSVLQCARYALAYSGATPKSIKKKGGLPSAQDIEKEKKIVIGYYEWANDMHNRYLIQKWINIHEWYLWKIISVITGIEYLATAKRLLENPDELRDETLSSMGLKDSDLKNEKLKEEYLKLINVKKNSAEKLLATPSNCFNESMMNAEPFTSIHYIDATRKMEQFFTAHLIVADKHILNSIASEVMRPMKEHIEGYIEARQRLIDAVDKKKKKETASAST